MKLVGQEIFKKDAVYVAKELLGKVISHNGCSGMIVETEAYMADPASHAWTRTPRSEIMFSSYAKWYIYLIYGMYNCLNITTNGIEVPGAVLIRALEPVEGIEKMKKRRSSKDIHNLCSGPGKLCDALGITRSLNGSNLNDKIKLYDYKKISNIKQSSRIGIKKGTELDWRFYVKDNPSVSR